MALFDTTNLSAMVSVNTPTGIFVALVKSLYALMTSFPASYISDAGINKLAAKLFASDFSISQYDSVRLMAFFESLNPFLDFALCRQ